MNDKIKSLKIREEKMLKVEENLLKYMLNLSEYLLTLPLDTEDLDGKNKQVLEVANLLAMTQQRQTTDFHAAVQELKSEVSRNSMEAHNQNINKKNKK